MNHQDVLGMLDPWILEHPIVIALEGWYLLFMFLGPRPDTGILLHNVTPPRLPLILVQVQQERMTLQSYPAQAHGPVNKDQGGPCHHRHRGEAQ